MVVLGIFFILFLPFDYIKYKTSAYYKKEKKKYRCFETNDIYFKIYNEIIKNDLPIKYYCNPNNNRLCCGWFIYENILIVSELVFLEYDEREKTWMCDIREERDLSETALENYLENAVKEANEIYGEAICDKAVILINSEDVESPEKAENNSKILLYNDDMAEVLKAFCNK